MKSLIKIIVLFLTISNIAFSQSTPQSFKYQAVARDADNNPLENENLDIRLAIVEDDAINGTEIYQEEHQVITTKLGLFSLNVGEGAVSVGDFEGIDWGSHKYFLRVEMKMAGQLDFLLMGTAPLLSVPFALHAKTVEDKDDADADPTNEMQTLVFDPSENKLSISGGNTVTIPMGGMDADADPENEIQRLEIDTDTVDLDTTFLLPLKLILTNPADTTEQDTVRFFDRNPFNELQDLYSDWDYFFPAHAGISEMDLKLTNSSAPPETVDADAFNEFQDLKITPDGENSILDIITPGGVIWSWVTIKDTDAKNEIQQLAKNGNVIGLNKGGGAVVLLDDDPNNELQKLSKEGNLIKLDKNGGNVIDEVDDADADPTNELQTIELMSFPYTPSGEKLRLTLKDPTGGAQFVEWENDYAPWNEIQELKKEGNVIKLYNNSITIPFSEVVLNDDDPTNELQDWGSLPGIPGDFSDGVDNVDDDDNDPINEIQTISKAGNLISLSKNGGQILLNDDDPTNELQSWLTLPLIPPGFGDGVDDEGPWEENPSTQTVTYEGKAAAGSFCTTSGSVVADDTGISRYQPSTGKNVSNICLEEYGNSVSGKIELLFDEILAMEKKACAHGAGQLNAFGANGDFNVTLNHVNGFPNHGLLGVVDGNNWMQAGAFIDDFGLGVIFGDIKNFRMEHPKDPNKEIWYASLEGPEAAAYERGTAQLENGAAFVPFSPHFQEVVNADEMTVMLTPLSAETYGLAVIKKTMEGFFVKELAKGRGNFEFDWEVKAVRKGYEDYKVIREKRDLIHKEH